MRKKWYSPFTILLAISLIGFVFHSLPAESRVLKPIGPIDGYTAVVSTTDKVISDKGGISCKNPKAAAAGLEILEKGGNAVDAMIASALVSTVTGTGSHSLGGYGGAMVIYMKKIGQPVVVDFNTRAPLAMYPEYFTSASELGGYSYKTITLWAPVAGLYTALHNYGTMQWGEVIQPAILVAEEGFALSEADARSMDSACKPPSGRFLQSQASIDIYCPSISKDSSGNLVYDSTMAYKAGDLFVQPDLADSLKLLAKYGPNDIYTGHLGKKMVDYLQSIGNLITLKDFAGWRESLVRLLQPAHANYRGYDVYTSPINTGGENLIEFLNILKNFDFSETLAATDVHLMIETYKAAFTDRFFYVADPWMANVPYYGLLAEEYGAERSEIINTSAASASYPVGDPWPYDNNKGPSYFSERKFPFVLEDKTTETSHSSAMDKEGNMVAMTFTMRDGWGSGITIPGTGITMNNGMGLFSIDPASLNRIEGGKLAVNNMNAYLIMKDGAPFVTSGAAGGRTIMTSCLETIVNLIDYGMDIYQAINTPRFHCEQLESTCYYENTYDASILAALAGMGHKTTDLRSSTIGVQHGVMLDPVSGKFIAGRDARSDVSSAGGFVIE